MPPSSVAVWLAQWGSTVRIFILITCRWRWLTQSSVQVHGLAHKLGRDVIKEIIDFL